MGTGEYGMVSRRQQEKDCFAACQRKVVSETGKDCFAALAMTVYVGDFG